MGKQCALRPDAQAFDEIRIVTVPRYKTSGLSGDEWRISAAVEFYRKGRLIHSESGWRNIQTVCSLLPWLHAKAIDDGHAYFAGDGMTCDQEGCSAPATVRYRRRFHYCSEGHQVEPNEFVLYRHFCETHRKRGDCGMDDADVNYIEEPYEPVQAVDR